MFTTNSIFKDTDEEESKQFMINAAPAQKKNNHEWIKQNLANILDDDNDQRNKKKGEHISQGNAFSLTQQFDSLDINANNDVQSVINSPFDTFGFSQNTANSGLKFPDANNESNESYFKNE